MSIVDVKVDLHVHSRHSDKSYSWFMQATGAAESYTAPDDVHAIATRRGMNLVTICDHDEIAGAVELCGKHANAFISEEISARFPEDGCIVHAIALNITEAQHAEIQRQRRDIYQLVAYLHEQDIASFLCHPLSPVNRRLTEGHIERCLLMFDNLELRNGTRDRAHEEALQALLATITSERLEDWARRHPQAPFLTSEGRYGLVGGSDDHAALSIARAFTSFRGEPTGKGLVEALRRRETVPSGETATAQVLSHNVYGVVGAHLRHVGQKAGPTSGGSRSLVATLLKHVDLADVSLGADPLDRVRADGHTDPVQDGMRRIIEGALVGAGQAAGASLLDAVVKAQPAEAADRLAEVVKAAMLAMPAVLGLRAFARDRRSARTFGTRLGAPVEGDRPPRVAVVTDSVDDVNGVTLGLRRLAATARAEGLDLRLVSLGDGPRLHTDGDGVVRVPALLRHRLKEYPQMVFGVPDLTSLLHYLVDEDIDVVQCSTPGPTGLVGLAAARLASVPVVGQYHTDLPEYILRITGDPILAEMFSRYVGWFYRATDRVLAPSEAVRARLTEFGVPPEQIELVPRGIDLDLFRPERRDHRAFEAFGLNGEPKVLFVGRLSREKGLDALVEGFAGVAAEIPDAKLLLVGDGPYAGELARRAPERVIFAGEQTGETLARTYASSDLFVCPSETETFGNVVVEAQAAGLPVIVANRGAARENVIDGVTGMVVDTRRPDDLRAAICHLLGRPALRRRMGAAGVAFARERYDPRLAALRTFGIYQRFLDGLTDARAGAPAA